MTLAVDYHVPCKRHLTTTSGYGNFKMMKSRARIAVGSVAVGLMVAIVPEILQWYFPVSVTVHRLMASLTVIAALAITGGLVWMSTKNGWTVLVCVLSLIAALVLMYIWGSTTAIIGAGDGVNYWPQHWQLNTCSLSPAPARCLAVGAALSKVKYGRVLKGAYRCCSRVKCRLYLNRSLQRLALMHSQRLT